MFFKISAAFFLVNLVSSLDHEALRGASRDLAECTGCWPGTSGNCKNPANNVCYLIAGDPLVCPAGTLPCGDPDPDDPDVVECTDCWGDTSGNCKHIVDSSCYYSPTGICTPGTLPCGDQDPEPVCINDIDRNRPLRPDAGCDSLLPVATLMTAPRAPTFLPIWEAPVVFVAPTSALTSLTTGAIRINRTASGKILIP